MALFERYKTLTHNESKGFLRSQFGVLVRALVIMGLLTWLLWKLFPGLTADDEAPDDGTILFVAPDGGE